MQTLYKIVVPNKKYVLIRFFNFFLFLLNAIGIAVMAHYKNILWLYLLVPFILIAAVYEITQLRVFKRRYVSETGIRASAFFWSLVGWLVLGYILFPLILVTLGLMQLFLRKKFEFRFNRQEILLKAFFERRIKWWSLENVVLKDALLTLDFKNNKILQSEILFEESNVPDEKEFNEFCRSQLKEHEKKLLMN
jgi:hypothetical protein